MVIVAGVGIKWARNRGIHRVVLVKMLVLGRRFNSTSHGRRIFWREGLVLVTGRSVVCSWWREGDEPGNLEILYVGKTRGRRVGRRIRGATHGSVLDVGLRWSRDHGIDLHLNSGRVHVEYPSGTQVKMFLLIS